MWLKRYLQKTNNNLTTYFFSLILSYLYFWIALGVPFLTERGLNGSQVFTLMSIYQLVGAFLEYPTGILGDSYGYKKMLTIGNYLSGISMLVLVYSHSYVGYLIGLILLALASGFLSGNDMAMLSSVSTKVKKDTANMHVTADLVFFLSAVIGGNLAKYIGYDRSLLLSGLLMASANIPLLFVHGHKKVIDTDKIYSLIDILKYSLVELKKPLISQLIIVTAIIGGFTFTIKSILGSFGNVYNIDITTISFYIGLGGLARAIGGKIYTIIPPNRALIPILLTALLTILSSINTSPLTTLNMITILQVSIGFTTALIDGDLQQLVTDNVRSSVFSLKRLILRLVSSSVLVIYGYALDIRVQNYVIFVIGILILFSAYFSKKYVMANLGQK